MPKFKVGQKIVATERGIGFEEATVLGIYTPKVGKFKGREMYLLKILCGTATVPVSVENNYQLAKQRK